MRLTAHDVRNMVDLRVDFWVFTREYIYDISIRHTSNCILLFVSEAEVQLKRLRRRTTVRADWPLGTP